MNVDEHDTWPEDWPEPEEKRYALLLESADPTTLTNIVMVTLTAGGVTSLSAILVTWLKTRRSNVRIDVERPDGTKFRVEATKILNPSEFRRETLEQIDKSKQVKISWDEKKPKSPKKK
ncbi:hypothetical protein ACFYOC_24190 [Nocardiopsis alba]|uniref:effector-associated constant component EACC1 n=1 Tax=Nocardiopsis alba TaxID=53437 RepID=UPI0036A40AE6